MSATTAAEPAPDKLVRHVTGPVRRILNVLLSVALTFLGLTRLTFFVGRIVPIDPVLGIVDDKALRATYNPGAAAIGLNLPIPVHYWCYPKIGACAPIRRQPVRWIIEQWFASRRAANGCDALLTPGSLFCARAVAFAGNAPAEMTASGATHVT